LASSKHKRRKPAARKGEVDEFKKLLSLSLNGDPAVAYQAQEKMMRLFQVKVQTAAKVFH
jgi:hypothetical protein